ncbi:hypothetical protein [Streptomyces sp. NPDC058466]|uniref:hypothetical protein n=1 Tax=Streptomyces sp. NPDC058466 TaxID=3346512 RepID=UPI0036695559
MPAISVGSVEVDVVPNARGIDGRLRAALLPSASQIGDEVGRIIGQRIATHIAPAVRDGINAGGRAARPAAARQGDETAGAFSRALKTRLEAAFRSLPKADVTLATTGFDADLARLRARMETLAGKRIGIDIDAGAALAQITDIEARLKRLGASHPNVQVRADTAAALAQLAAVRAEVNAVDGRTARVDINTGLAQVALSNLATAAVAFGPAILPALPVVAAGLGAVAAAAVAAGAGIASIALVAIPAFKQIGTVLQAQKAAQQAATNATYQGGQANSQGASKALQMAGAQQALATAERNGARQIAQAQAQVTQAKRAAADAIAQAALRNQQAARAVQDAERSLADAQVAAKKAQEDLTAARKQAAQELEDLNNQLTDSVLSQRDAEIALKEATIQRDAVLKSATATELDKQKAILQYDQAVQRLKEQTTETGRLKEETKAANKAGVEGSATVTSAQDKVAQAQRTVADQARAVKDAQAEAARVQVQTAQQVADAQQKVSDATANVAVAQQNAADAVASAQRQIETASISSAGGVDQAAIAQAKYQAELAKLTPAARDTFNAFLDLRTAFSAWSKSLQPAVMPIFTRALVSLKNTLPTLTPFVKGAADAIKELQDRASASVKSPFWQGFKKDLQANVKPAIVGLGVAFGNVLKGMAGIVDAFLPHMDGISGRLQGITKRFADWGAGLKGSPEFERFLQFASDKAPILGDTLGKIATAFLNVGEALSPLSGPLLKLLGGAAEFIAVVADKAPWYILLLYGVILATKLWTLAVAALNFVMEANPIVLIGLAILALMAVVIYAYDRFGWFRAGVQAAWDGIKTGALFLWNVILKPAFNGIMLGLQTVGQWAMWLWTTAIKPAFDGIVLAGQILITAILTILVLPFVLAFQGIAAIATWLWQTALLPAFTGIAAVASWLWTNGIKPVVDAFVGGLKTIGSWGKWLWDKAIKPAFDGIVTAIGYAWTHGIKPVFNAIGDAIKGALGPVFRGLRDNVVKPVWSAIKSAISTAWDKGIRPVFDALKSAVGKVGDAFNSAKDAIKTAWDKVKGIAKAPVKFVIDTVYNNGIVAVWNKIAGAFGAPTLNEYHPKGWATGGVLPGYTPGRDVHRYVSPTGGMLDLSGGEAIMRPEWTRAVGPGYVNAMNAAARSGGVGGVQQALGFKDGGIFGWIGSAASALKGAGSDAWNAVKKGASWLADTLEASARAGVNHVVDPLLKHFPGMDTGIGKMIRHIPTKIIDALFGYSKEADKKSTPKVNYTPSAGVEQWRPVVIKALHEVGQPVGLAQSTLRRMNQESGGNPTIVNKWDSNWQAGHPSVGLMQVIGPTFRHYAGKYKKTGPFSYGVSVNPMANIYSSMKYALGAYGSLSRAYDRPGGYDSGGYLQPGLNLAYNGTGRPEPVFTTTQANALTSLAARSASQQLGDLQVAVYVGNEQITDIARAEVRTAQGELIQVLNAS